MALDGSARPLRKDAEANLERILASATVTAWSLQGVLDVTRGLSVTAWPRHLEVLLAGLRPASHSLRTPALTPTEMDAVIRATPTAPTERNDPP